MLLNAMKEGEKVLEIDDSLIHPEKKSVVNVTTFQNVRKHNNPGIISKSKLE
jgi:hypothetical protein